MLYQIPLSGIAGPESDVVKARVYVANGASKEVAVTPGAGFQITVTSAVSGNVLIEYTYVDASGQESQRFQQTVSVPDLQPPSRPTAPLTVGTIIWQ